MKRRIGKKLSMKIAGIRCIILDVDGVLTDGRIIFDDRGRELKFFDVRDGHGIKLLMRAGIDVILLTGRISRVVDLRARDLGIKEVYQGEKDKLEAFENITARKRIQPHQIACLGDDVTDIPLLKRAGFSVVVADAPEYVRKIADYVTERAGGRGAVREICELILQVQGKWDAVVEKYDLHTSRSRKDGTVCE
ncbi:MAG: KdsC family phosphatase [Syntrophales bacterium]